MATDLETFEKSISSYLKDPNGLHIPFEWFRQNFDSFADDNALDRLAIELTTPAKPPGSLHEDQ